jgi:hypothetical protein
VSELDWPRAVLATQYLYNPNGPALRRTDVLTHIQLERLGASVVADLAYVIDWIGDWSGTRPLDHFFRELFNDLWSQVRSGDNRDRVAEREAAVCNWLAEKAGRFRRAAPVLGLAETSDQARALVSSILQGLVTGDPLPGRASETVQDEYPSVLIATIYAYLLSGPVVDYQVWLDGASMGWWDIPRQPLSNAFVLTPHWPADQPWTEADSFAMRNQLLARIVHGLCVRCRKGVLLTSSELDERGERQDGPLWRALMPLIDADYWKRA